MAAVETQQRWKKHDQGMLHTHSKRDTAESAANRVRTLRAYIMNLQISCLLAMYMLCTSVLLLHFFQENKSRGAPLHAFNIYQLSCLEQYAYFVENNEGFIFKGL
jgi:hypothetical protein